MVRTGEMGGFLPPVFFSFFFISLVSFPILLIVSFVVVVLRCVGICHRHNRYRHCALPNGFSINSMWFYISILGLLFTLI